MQISQIGLIILVGAGKMGMAMARGWLKNGLKPNNLILVDPKPHDEVIKFAKQGGISLLASFPHVDAKVVILAVKPQIISSVMSEIKSALNQDTLVLSIAGGITLAALNKGLGTKNIIRVMPNTPAQVGQGVSGAVLAQDADENSQNIAQALLSASGIVEWFSDEKDLDALTLVSGCGPAYVFLLAEAMANAGVEQGLKQEQAMALARQTIIGAAALMQEDATDAATLRKNVTSPGGITEAALSVLMAEEGFYSLFSRAFQKARKRNDELGS